MASKSYFVVNIMEYLCDAPMEEALSGLCSLYECPLNKDVESFLKKSAVEFARKHQAVSYLVFSQKNGAFLGYFSLAIKTISVKAQNVSRTIQRKLSRMSTLDEGEYNIPAYLIAQLGKKLPAWAQRLDFRNGSAVLGHGADFASPASGGWRSYCKQNHFVEFGTRNAKATDKSLLQLLKTI